MRAAILDAAFPLAKQAGRGLAARYLAWDLARNGECEYPLDDADTLLVTCTSPIDASILKRLRAKYPNKSIVAGGAGSTSPHSLGIYADAVCVGDGQEFIHTLCNSGLDAAKQLPNAWVHGDLRRVEVDQRFPWDMPPIQAEDGAYRLWCGRGCKNKCAFCQTGWAHTYSEHPDPDSLVRAAQGLLQRGKRINYLSNDPAQHSFFARLPPVDHGSYSVRFLAKHGLPHARQIRLGVEGVSERLRSAVGKPISDEDLIGCTSWLNANGKGVRWFMIAGLPGETAEDWIALRQTIRRWKERTPKGVLGISFTAWCPDPATPLATLPVTDEYWQHFAEFREWFFSGVGWSNRIKLMMPQAPESRIKKAEFAMGLPEKSLREGGDLGPNQRVSYPYEKSRVAALAKYLKTLEGSDGR